MNTNVMETKIKKLEESVKHIKNTVFQVDGLCMEIPFIITTKLINRTKFIEKVRQIYDNCNDNFSELDDVKSKLKKKEFKEYVKQLNIYLNALAILECEISRYIYAYSTKFGGCRYLDTIYTYYHAIGEKLDMYSTKYQKYVRNFSDKYYE